VLKKVFATVGLAVLLALGGGSAASAYPATASCSANPTTFAVGGSTTILCVGLRPLITGTLTVTGPGVQPGSLSSIVLAGAVGSASVTKTTTPEGTVAVTFTGPIVPGAYTISLVAEDGASGSTTVNVVPAGGSGTGGTSGGTQSGTGGTGLSATGGTVPAAAIWFGVGAVGLGAIAVAAAASRRRAQNRR